MTEKQKLLEEMFMKKKTGFIALTLAVLFLTACGSGMEPEKETSPSVLAEAQAYVEQGEYDQAHALLYAQAVPSAAEKELLSRLTYQCVEKVASNGGKRVWTYNDQGLVLTDHLTNADGSWKKTVTSYDSKGNLVSEVTEDSSGYKNEDIYAYDENGRKLAKMTNEESVTNYRYNDAGQLIAEEDISGFSKTTYTYDDRGNLVKELFSVGDALVEYTYTYDDNGNKLKTKMEDEDRWFQYTYTYDKDGNMLTEDYKTSGGVSYQQTYTYDEKGNMLTMKRTTDSGWQELTYTYDDHGNNVAVKSVNSKGETIEYTCAYQIFYTPAAQ